MQLNRSRTSPNQDTRKGHAVKVVILHATVGTLQSSLNWLCNPISKVSSHYLISQEGVIYQLVEESACAWHAGVAEWQGQTAVNEISIGVELVNRTGMAGFRGQDPYTPAQITSLTDLARNIQTRHPDIAFTRHLDVALPKGRKTDPIYFQWVAWLADLKTAPPRPISNRYRVRGVPIHQAPDVTSPVALGGTAILAPGTEIAPDQVKDGWAHVPEGFIDVKSLEAL